MWYSPYTAAGKKSLVASNKNADNTVVNSCSIFWGVTQGCNGGGLMWGCRERGDLLRSSSHVKWGKWGSKPHRVLGCHVSTKGNPRGRSPFVNLCWYQLQKEFSSWLKTELLYFEWSPPTATYSGILSGISKFYKILKFYLTCVLALTSHIVALISFHFSGILSGNLI